MKKSSSRIYELQLEIGTFQQNDCMGGSYFSTLISMWEKLSHYQPLPKSDEWRKYTDNQHIYDLRGLNPKWGYPATILSSDILPFFGTVYLLFCMRKVILGSWKNHMSTWKATFVSNTLKEEKKIEKQPTPEEKDKPAHNVEKLGIRRRCVQLDWLHMEVPKLSEAAISLFQLNRR